MCLAGVQSSSSHSSHWLASNFTDGEEEEEPPLSTRRLGCRGRRRLDDGDGCGVVGSEAGEDVEEEPPSISELAIDAVIIVVE